MPAAVIGRASNRFKNVDGTPLFFVCAEVDVLRVVVQTGSEVGMIAMLQHAAAWNKLQTNLSLEEAVKVSVEGLLPNVYVISDSVRRFTRGYHHNNSDKLRNLFLEIAKTGHDVIDECEERIYRCVKNIDDEGSDPVMVAYARDDLKHRGSGLITTLGLGKDGVLSSEEYGGVFALNSFV